MLSPLQTFHVPKTPHLHNDVLGLAVLHEPRPLQKWVQLDLVDGGGDLRRLCQLLQMDHAKVGHADRP